MHQRFILISGPSISKDIELISELEKIATVIVIRESSNILQLLKLEYFDLVLYELPDSKVDLIRLMKEKSQNIKIIIIDGDRDAVVQGFRYGATDAFRKPYRGHLLVERVRALMS